MPQSLTLKLSGGRIEVAKAGSLALVGWYEGGRWGVEGDLVGYRPSEDVEVEGVWGEVVRGVEVNGHVRAGGEGAGARVRGRAWGRGRWRGLRWQGTRWEVLWCR